MERRFGSSDSDAGCRKGGRAWPVAAAARQRALRRPLGQTALAACVAFTAPPAAGADSFCRDGEEILFNCHAAQRIISVCASNGWTAASGYLQYRYGSPERIEIAIPRLADGVPPSRSASRGVLIFSGGGGAYLRFASSGDDYVVYTAVNAGWGEKAGVAVQRDGQTKRHRACSGKVTSALGPALFSKAAFAEDEQGFDVP